MQDQEECSFGAMSKPDARLGLSWTSFSTRGQEMEEEEVTVRCFGQN